MKTEPIAPAGIDWSGEVPRASEYGDVYHPRIGAVAQAEHVFLRGNGLPDRWRGHAAFTILETGFGLGFNFLAAWAAWRADPARAARLHYVAIEKHPPRIDDLRRAQAAAPAPLQPLAAALQAQWPPLTPNLHRLAFDGGRVRLLLALGDVAAVLPALEVQADAVFLDGFAPDRNPAMWSAAVFDALGRKVAPEATAATWCVARELRDGLARAGFEVERAPGIGGKREISVARHVARPGRRQPPALAVGGASREAVVVGAGIAGAAVARALLDDDWAVTVLERRPAAASETSSNLGGLFHGSLHPDDGPHARLLRAAALQAARDFAPPVTGGAVPGQVQGLMWLDRRAGGLAALADLHRRTGLPGDYVHPLAAADAAARAGVPLSAPAWCYPAGGWISPAQVAAWLLRGSRFVGGVEVARLARVGDRWQLRDARDAVVAEAALVALCASAGVPALLAPLAGTAPRAWPLQRTRGQVSVLERGGATPLALPLTGDGYALPLPDGRLLVGATRQPGDDDASVRDADHRYNAGRAARLTGLELPPDPAAWSGRVGWRLHASDRQPIAGAVAAADASASQPRLLERQPGLFVVSALGSRGLTLAPLLGHLVAAMAGGAPWPLERDLAAAIDPGRWPSRSSRREAGDSPGEGMDPG